MSLIESFMSRLGFRQKMLLIAAVFLLPLLTAIIMLARYDNNEIAFLQTEKQGLQYIRALRQLYQHIPEHRGMMHAYLNGHHEYRSKIMAKREAILADLAAIDRLSKQEHTLLNHPQWQQIRQAWQALENKAFQQTASAVFKAHTQLVNKILNLMHDIALNANLINDHGRDSRLLIEVLIYKLPFITEGLGQLRGLGAGIASAQMITLAQRVKLESKLATIEDYFHSSDQVLSQLLAERPVLKNKLEIPLQQRQQWMTQFIEQTRNRVLLATSINLDAKDFFQLGTQAIQENYRLFDILLPTLEQLLEQRLSDYTIQRNTIITVSLICLMFALTLFAGFYRSTLMSIHGMIKAASQIAEGDLTTQVRSTSADEIARIAAAMNKMVEHLQKMMRNLETHSSSLASASEELSTTSLHVADNSRQQQQETAQITASIQELTVTVEDIAQSAALLDQEINNANQETQNSSQVISQTITSINTLASGVGNAVSVINELQESSTEIGSVLSVIKGVAEQTNLLALNAAIEAARAGEHGRGFAVVADEVRTLATRTQESAEQIQQMVDNLQQHIQRAVTVMNNEQDNAHTVSTQTQDVTESLQRVLDSMAKVSATSSQVATTAQRQGSVSVEIKQNVVHVAELTDDNVHGVQEIATATRELAKMAAELESIVQFFKLN